MKIITTQPIGKDGLQLRSAGKQLLQYRQVPLLKLEISYSGSETYGDMADIRFVMSELKQGTALKIFISLATCLNRKVVEYKLSVSSFTSKIVLMSSTTAPSVRNQQYIKQLNDFSVLT